MRSTDGKGVDLPPRDAARKGARPPWLALAASRFTRPVRAFWLDRASAWFAYRPPFLGPADFQGSFTPRQREATDGIQSTYSGTVVVTSVDRAIVQQMLPPGLQLATPLPNVWGGSTHPVMHLIGAQRSPSTLVLGNVVPVPAAPGYQEMILLVPFVVKANGTLWHNYVVRMFLDHIIPVFGGNELYGYAKVLARLDQSQQGAVTTHKVASVDGATTWFSNDIDAPAAPAAATAAPPPRWSDVRKILDMPVLGIRPDGVMVCSYWEFGGTNATVAATASRHHVITRFTPGMQAWETLGTLRSAPNGAFAMNQFRWRVAWPWLVQGC